MIRPIVQSDKDEFIKMSKEFYSSDAVAHTIPSENHNITFQELMRSDTYAACYIIEDQHQYAGYALLAKTFSQEAGGMVVWIEEIYIRPSFRSQGLGGDFFAYLKQNLDTSVARIRLEVEDGNTGAIKLYEKLGFEKLEYSQMIMDL